MHRGAVPTRGRRVAKVVFEDADSTTKGSKTTARQRPEGRSPWPSTSRFQLPNPSSKQSSASSLTSCSVEEAKYAATRILTGKRLELWPSSTFTLVLVWMNVSDRRSHDEAELIKHLRTSWGLSIRPLCRMLSTYTIRHTEVSTGGQNLSTSLSDILAPVEVFLLSSVVLIFLKTIMTCGMGTLRIRSHQGRRSGDSAGQKPST